MNIIVQIITSNSEQPVYVLDINKVSPNFKDKVERSVQNKETWVAIEQNEWDEVMGIATNTPFPCVVDGFIELVFD